MSEQIVFCRAAAAIDYLHVFAIAPDGSGLTQLTSGDSHDFNIVGGSLDGTQIAAVTGAGDLWVMSADGSGERQITNLSAGGVLNGTELSWSPDGTQIVLGSATADFQIVNADNSGHTDVTVSGGDANTLGVFWSPDGNRLAFTNNSGFFSGVSTCNLDGSGEIEVIASVSPYAYEVWDWYPDSANLLVLRQDRDTGNFTTLLKTDGATTTTLYDDPTGATFGGFAMALSPDASKVAWVNLDVNRGLSILSAGAISDLGPGVLPINTSGIDWMSPATPPIVPPSTIAAGQPTTGIVRLS